MKPNTLIGLINRRLRFFTDEHFSLRPTNPEASHYVLTGTSSAYNRFPKRVEPVKVIKWFSNFWLFLEITFMKNETEGRSNEFQITISLSVFQGDDSDDEKCQLFRAEWDDYNNPDEKHAQPHWHITSNQAIENAFEKYAGLDPKRDSENESFLELLDDERKKVFDVKKIHFAMNADWQDRKAHTHKISGGEQIVHWLQGMLNCLRNELQG